MKASSRRPPTGMVAWWTGDDCTAVDRFARHDGSFTGAPNCLLGWKVAVVHTPGASQIASGFDLTIGALPLSPLVRDFTGSLDEVAIHARALAPGELEEIRLADDFGMCKIGVHVRVDGYALGGFVQLTAAGVSVGTTTSAGDTPEAIALALAAAVGSDPMLAAMQVEAVAVGAEILVSNAEVQAVSSTDPGILLSLGEPPPPATGVPALGLATHQWIALVVLLALVAGSLVAPELFDKLEQGPAGSTWTPRASCSRGST